MKHLEIKTIEHRGIKVMVKIDYDAAEISLMEQQPNTVPIAYKPKDWKFTKRGIEYMDAWVVILEAMQVAIKEAKKDLNTYLKEKEDKAIKMVDEMHEAVIKIGKKHNKGK